MDPILLRPAAAARHLSISRTALYGLLARGEIASVKCGASRLIPTEELRRWLDRQIEAVEAANQR